MLTSFGASDRLASNLAKLMDQIKALNQQDLSSEQN